MCHSLLDKPVEFVNDLISSSKRSVCKTENQEEWCPLAAHYKIFELMVGNRHPIRFGQRNSMDLLSMEL